MADPTSVLLTARLELARLPAVLDGLLGDLDPADWRARPVAPEWAPVEIVCHLRDEEVEDFGARVRVALEGGSRFTPIDPERWAEERRYRDADPWEALAAFRDRRKASLAFLASVPPIASRLPSSIRGSGGCPASTSSSRGLPMIGSTSPSFPARWRGCGPHAGRRSVPTTRGRSRTESPSGDAVLAPERVT